MTDCVKDEYLIFPWNDTQIHKRVSSEEAGETIIIPRGLSQYWMLSMMKSR